MGNRTKDTTGAVAIGEFRVEAMDWEARTIIPLVTGWVPYVYLDVWALDVPTSGYVTAWWIRERELETKLINGLQLRDTATHTPDSDPDKILIVEW